MRARQSERARHTVFSSMPPPTPHPPALPAGGRPRHPEHPLPPPLVPPPCAHPDGAAEAVQRQPLRPRRTSTPRSPTSSRARRWGSPCTCTGWSSRPASPGRAGGRVSRGEGRAKERRERDPPQQCRAARSPRPRQARLSLPLSLSLPLCAAPLAYMAYISLSPSSARVLQTTSCTSSWPTPPGAPTRPRRGGNRSASTFLRATQPPCHTPGGRRATSSACTGHG